MTTDQQRGGSPDDRAGEPHTAASIHGRIAARASLRPDAIAVVEGAHRLSYRDLDTRANQLAHHLRALGSGPDTVVGIGLPRGLDLVVALLAVWKTGAGYLPFDLEHPAERIARQLEDARPALLVTTTATAAATVASAAAEANVRVVDLDSASTLIAAQPADAPQTASTPSSVAYVMYTSGSTGRPKGVVISHAGIANRINWAVRRHGLDENDRVLQKTALTFDAHCWEVFAPLVAGGTLVLAPHGAERDPAALVLAVAEHDVTVLQVVPSVLRMLVDEPGWEQCRTLRLLFSAGEPLHAELVQRLLARIPALEVWNTYGPTECSIDVTAQLFDPAQQLGPVPIGRPIEGMRVLVLGPDGAPVPIGVPGELHVGGVGVARGYLGRPGLTAELFVPDPYGPAGGRLYRTGDLVRWRADATIEYLGRMDQQVKVNGVRIEPAEVEAALAAHPAVRGAVVTAFASGDGGKRLAGYLLARDGAPTAAELRSFLRERLPETHVPAVFLTLDAFPLTTSGKVDRAALPAPEPDDADRRNTVPPRNEAEHLVATVWQQLLKVDEVGAHDDFFALGGTSLQLTRLANQLRVASGREIRLRGLFQATTVAAQAELISAGAVQTPAAPAAGLPRVDRSSPLALSFGQRRLWFLDRLNPGSAEWVSPLLLRVDAEVSAATVQRALDALVLRHEVLRTRYQEQSGEPVQLVDETAAVELKLVETTRADLPAVLVEAFDRRFDLERGPVLHATLARIPDEQQVLVLAIHHIAVDGWSSAVLHREFQELVSSERAGRTAVLPELTAQYADHAAWQRAQLTDEVVERELGYWRTALEGLQPLALPTDRPRSAVRDSHGSVVSFTVPAPLAQALTDLGKRQGATPFMTLLTAFATVLARHSGQWDLPIGTPVAGRTGHEVENVVGFFLNSLVLRCSLDGRLGFGQALDRVRENCREAFAHQELPFERLVDEMEPDRDLSRTPLYQVAFDLHDGGLTGSLADLDDLQAFQQAWRIAKTDLTLFMRQQPDGTFAGGFEYATAILDQATVERLAGHFLRLLQEVVADPQLRLDSLGLLSEPELRQLTLDWNDTAVPRSEAGVHLAFEAQAAATPAAVAVRTDDSAVSYAELDARADAVARYLHGLGVGPESVVAVMVERGVELIVALLGVWKAGAAYLPLDLSHPADRVGYMIEDAGARVVITRSEHAPRIAGHFAGQLVLLDQDAEAIGTKAPRLSAVPADPDRLAYVIYTSGSTGRPKGVQVTHRGLANHLRWAVEELASRGTSGAPLFSSVAFDLVVPNLWAPLLSGQTVRVFPEQLDLTDLGRRLTEAGPFSFVKLTPGHLEILTHQLDPTQAAALAPVLVVAGDALSGRLADHWRGLLGDGRLINEYGPTEASVGSSTYPVGGADQADVVPIGRPLPNMTMYVLDAMLQPVPIGVAGELHIGGIGVARGYVKRPGATAASFLPDPFGPPGSRLYRTGDLARTGPDGNIHFLGRIDHQVKIHGYRIELGEIQAVLAEHPGVREAVVLADEPTPGEKRLVAYLVAAEPEARTAAAEELAAHCATRLPGYMVPSRFTVVEAIPLNANGKVDRAALPGLGAVVAGPERVAPRNAVEQRVADIWAELLTAEFGVHDNFFALGGNSILAIQLTSRLQSEFEVALPVRAIFEGPTVAGLAEEVEALIRAEIDQMSDSEVMADALLPEGRDA